VLNLEPCHDPHYHLEEVTHDATAYYLREGEAPGVWRGSGAVALGLAGEVTPQALHDLFQGKNPADGTFLISARGSASRASARAAEASLDVAAVAARLDLSQEAVRARLRSGVIEGHKGPGGAWHVPPSALDAYRAAGSPPPGCRPPPGPGPDGTYGLAEAARVAGVTRSYLCRIVADRPPALTTREDGKPAQYLFGRRDARGHWRVDAAELERFMADRREPRAVPAYDLALRAPKSVSILHALGHLVPARTLARLGLPANLAVEVVEAHHAAVEDTVGFLERRAAWVRGPQGRVQAAGLAAALFDHRSSRAGDPLLHTHVVIANVATGVDGRRAALDGTALYAWAKAGGHVYQARLRAELVGRLGVRFEPPHHGVADIAGMPRALVEHFSERRREILEVMRRLGLEGAAAAQRAALATRRPKDDHAHQRPEQLAARAAALGVGPAQLAALMGHGPARPFAVADRERIAAHLASPEGLTARTTRVDLRDAVCGFATELPEGATAAQLESWATALLHDPARFVPVLGAPTRAADVIRRGDGRRVRAGGVERTYATPELLAQEAAVVAAHTHGWGERGRGVGAGVATPEAVEAALAARPTMRGEQVEMVRRITTSGLGVDVVVGGPGSGKTYALGAAAEAWRASGLRVVGASLQGGAAEVLAAEADLDERYTLAGLLLACRREGPGLLARSVVVVDEAGMADTRQLARLAARAAEAGAKVVLVGDPDQIPEVGAGGAFRFLVERLGSRVVALRENHRQLHASDRRRLGLIRRGEAEEAIASAQADGRWHTAATADAARHAMLAAWAADPGEIGRDKFMIATSVAEVEWLNRAARAMLGAEGALGDEALTVRLRAPGRAVDRRELRVGDRVRAARNDWRRRVFTGMVGTVTAVDPGAFAVGVVFDRDRDRGDPRPLTLGRAYLEEARWTTSTGKVEVVAPGLTHAYASTANGVQGRTATRAYVLVAEAGLYRQAAFTAASRARLETHYFALTVPDPDEIARHDRPSHLADPDPADTAALARAMWRDGAQTMAVVADPLAAEVGELMGRPPAWLWAERARLAERLGAGLPLAEGLRRVRAALVAAYGLDRPTLEDCAPLTAALSACLRVPGATPERLTALVLARRETRVRELDSADDPLAVLVWAAGRHAHGVLAAEAAARVGPGREAGTVTADATAERRLRILDEAIGRQRLGRLAATEADPPGHVVAVLGPTPDHPGALGPWRRGAAALLDYRDAAGLFDRPGTGGEGFERALGSRPQEAVLGAHHDDARAALLGARVAILLAGLPRHVPPLDLRPPPPVETLAQRPLAELGAELADLRTRREDREALGVALARARRQAAEAERAAQEVAGRRRRGGRHLPRRGNGDAGSDPSLAAAEPGATAARERVAALEDRLARSEEPATERMQDLEAAIAVRQGRLQARVLTDPPPWVVTHLRERAEEVPPSAQLVGRLAAAYGEAAALADRAGRPLDAPCLNDLLGLAPGDPERLAAWHALQAELGAAPHDPPAPPLQLGR
jgi:conjugative relaxase-like TrwC/TraI family protein